MRRVALLAVFFLCAVVTLRAGALDPDAYLVFVSPGEDAATQTHVSWHSAVSGTRLEYTTRADTGYADSTIVSGSSISQTFDSTTFGSGFYRCHVLLEGLERGTEYIFRVGKTAFTGDHHFKTAEGGGELRFIFMSDVHAYPPIPSRVGRAESLVSRAEERHGESDFMVIAGDLTAHGANYTHWEELAAASFVPDYMMVTTPGNHDYYNSSAVTIDDRFYNSAFRNPGNGASGAVNTTYWFKHNDTLFISLNTEANSTAQITSQKAWLREVVANNPAQFIIAYAHRAFFLGATTIVGGGVVRKSSDSYPWFGSVLEELEVDLVLAGHNHVYVRTKPIFNGAVAGTQRGTVYITANQIGDRGRMAASDLGEYGEVVYGGSTDSNGISTVSVITVTSTAINGQMFDEAGVVYDNYSIPARRAPIDDSFREAYSNAYSARVNPPDLSWGILGFGSEGHEKVARIEVLDAEAGAVYASFAPGEDMTEAFFGPLEAGRAYQLLVSTIFRDGSTGVASVSLLNKLFAGSYEDLRVEEGEDEVLLMWENALVAEEIGSIRVAVNDEWSVDLAGDVDSVDISPGLTSGSNMVEFTVIDRYGDAIFEEELDYIHSPSEEDEDPVVDPGEDPGHDDDSPDNHWNVVGGGCGAASVPGVFFLVFMVVSTRKPAAKRA